MSFDAVARASGITKPGVLYHFPTKKALVLALVDHVIDQLESDLRDLVGSDMESAEVEDRLVAYLRWAVTYEHDAGDLVMLSDPKLRTPMSQRWADRMDRWTSVPPELSGGRRARLNALRLLADGAWYAEATGIGALPKNDRLAVLEAGLNLLNGVQA